MKKLIIKFRNLPEYVRMVVVALIGTIIGYVTYEIIFYLNPFHPKATISWFLSYIITILRQHSLHRQFTFTTHKTPYWRSLMKAFVMYFSSLCLSSGLNYLMIEVLHINHRITWATCLIVTAFMSLFFLKKYVFKSSKSTTV